MAFQIDPKVQIGLMLGVGMVTFLGSNALPPEVPANVATGIRDWCVWLGQLYLIVIGPGLGLYTNSNPGPLAPQDPPNVVAATKINEAKAEAANK